MGCYALLQGNLSNSRIEPACLMSPALASRFSTTSAKLGSLIRNQGGLWGFLQITQWVAAGVFCAMDQPEPAVGEKWWLRMIGWGFMNCVLRGNLTCNQFHQDIPLGSRKQLPFRIAKKKEFRGRQRTNLVLGSAEQLFSSVQFSHLAVSNSLWPHESQHARPPCPSPTPRVYSNSCPSSRWCHPASSSSVLPFSSCPQSLPASESFPMSQLFAWGGQSTGVSALVSVLPKNTQDWSPLEWTGWISLQSKGLSRVFSSTTVQKHQFILIFGKTNTIM